MKTKHLLSLLLFTVCTILCALPDQEAPIYLFYPNGPKVTALTEAPKANPVEKVTITAPKEGAVMRLLHTVQKKYVFMPHDERIAYFADAKKREEMKSQGYHPKTVTLQWNSVADNVKSYQVVISEKKDFVPAIAVAVTEPKLELNNLKIAMTYYWKVTAITDNGSFDSPVATFATEEKAPRLLKINGVPNVRDLGGRVGLDGRRVRQGIVYRTAGLNNNAHRLFLSKLEALGEHPEIIGDEELLTERIQKAKDELAHVQPVEYVRYSISPERTTFCPEGKVKAAQAAEFLKLTESPDTFLGANKTVRSVDANGELSVENPSEGKLALFMQVFESPRDGYMQIGCAADWNWCMAVNNVKVIDYMRQGNGH
ncbi:MAG: tyrosine-protein phosphatase, partial [Victivallales bacterium]|nr:tyrosine-protein phosphatase [Victivallales bacterium]